MNLDIETMNASNGSVQRINAKSAEEADHELPSKTAVATASGEVAKTSLRYPPYRDRVSWLAVIYKSVPDAVGLAGLKYAFNSAEVRWRRLLWILLVVAGTGVCCYQVIDRSIYFASNPKSLDVSINEVSRIPFPTIAICNYNKYKASVVNGTEFGNFLTEGFLSPTTLNYSEYYDTLSASIFNEVLLNSTHGIVDSIFRVLWDRFPISNPAAYFTLKLMDWGPCIIFNDADNGLDGLVVETSGRATAGLDVSIDVQQGEYFYDPPWSYLAAGLHVAIYPRGTQPYVEDMGFSVAPGTFTLIGLDLEENVYLPPPFGYCENKTLKYFDYYGASECVLECAGEFLASRCGCVVFNLPGDVPECTSWEFYTCATEAFEDFVYNYTCDCTQPCATRSYAKTMSQAAFPAEFFTAHLASSHNTTTDYFRENIVRLNIYFRNLKVVTKTQQRDYTFFGLLCDIGGSLGLWLGGSILTFFEIIDLFGHATYVYCRRSSPK